MYKKRFAVSLFIATLLLSGRVWADAVAIQPGVYMIVSETVMPHLEEMRRNKSHERGCLRDGEPEAVFPVLRQPAFKGCMLMDERRENGRRSYGLQCETDYVATGSAQLDVTPERIVATLRVQMGGKNMTFTQRVEAVRHGPCDEGEGA
jgi:hypothetical protein